MRGRVYGRATAFHLPGSSAFACTSVLSPDSALDGRPHHRTTEAGGEPMRREHAKHARSARTKHPPTGKKRAGRAYALPAKRRTDPGLTRRVRPLIFARLGRSALFDLLDDPRVRERRRVAELAALRDISKQAAHDLAAPCLRQLGRE